MDGSDNVDMDCWDAKENCIEKDFCNFFRGGWVLSTMKRLTLNMVLAMLLAVVPLGFAAGGRPEVITPKLMKSYSMAWWR